MKEVPELAKVVCVQSTFSCKRNVRLDKRKKLKIEVFFIRTMKKTKTDQIFSFSIIFLYYSCRVVCMGECLLLNWGVPWRFTSAHHAKHWRNKSVSMCSGYYNHCTVSLSDITVNCLVWDHIIDVIVWHIVILYK